MGKTALSPAPVVARAALALLTTGPLEEDVLTRRLIAGGLVLGDDPGDRLFDVLDPDRVVELDDERLVDLVALASGVVFSHQLSAEEIAGDRVTLHPDLSVLDALAAAGVALDIPGGQLDHDHEGDDGDHCVLVGPAGWLSRAAALRATAAGDVMTVHVADGAIEIDVVSGPLPVTTRAVEALRGAFEMLTGTEADTDSEDGQTDAADQAEAARPGDDVEPVELFTVWLEAMVADPEAFRRAQAPMSQLLAGAGLEVRGELVAPSGFDWDEWESIVSFEAIARRWQLDEVGAMAWMVVSRAYRRMAAGDLPETETGTGTETDPDTDGLRAGLAAMMSHGTVAQAFVGESLGDRPDRDGSVAAFAQRLLDAASAQAQAGPRWLLAICAERDGRTLEAEALVTEALAADGAFLPALEDASWYAADRGDARRAASLLRRAGADADDEILSLYDRFARTPTAPVGRNDRCPCGSGRKYKHCHLGKEALPVSERCAFLYQKAGSYLQRGIHGQRLFDIATAMAGGSDDLMAVHDALANPIVADLALFEDGVWDEFVRARGMLLPTDERQLAEQWPRIERSIHEVQAVDPGRGLTARGARTGEVVEVTERTASRQLEAGELICARIVPAGQGYRIFGGIERVGRHQRHELMALLDSGPNGVELAAWFGAAHARIRLVDWEDEPIDGDAFVDDPTNCDAITTSN